MTLASVVQTEHGFSQAAASRRSKACPTSARQCLDSYAATSGNNGAALATETCTDQSATTDPTQIWALSATDG